MNTELDQPEHGLNDKKNQKTYKWVKSGSQNWEGTRDNIIIRGRQKYLPFTRTRDAHYMKSISDYSIIDFHFNKQVISSYLNQSSLLVKFIFDLASFSDLHNLQVTNKHWTSKNSKNEIPL